MQEGGVEDAASAREIRKLVIRASIVLMNGIGVWVIQSGAVAVSVVEWRRPRPEWVSKAAVGFEEESHDCACPQFASGVAEVRLSWPCVPGSWKLWVGQWA